MKRIWTHLCAGAIALTMVLGLSACSLGGGVNAKDATVYIRGLINQTFMGQFDEDYLKLVDSNTEEAAEIYDGNLGVDAENLAYSYAIDTMTDNLNAQIKELFQAMYAKSKFEVKDAVKQDQDTFSVEVSIDPLDIYQRVDDAWEEFCYDFNNDYLAAHSDEDLDAAFEAGPGNAVYDVYDEAFGEAVIQLFYEKLEEAVYLDTQSVVVQLKRGENNVWEIPDNQFNSLDDYFNYYNY